MGMSRSVPGSNLKISIDPLFAKRLSPMAQLARVARVEEFADVLRTDRKTRLHRADEEALRLLETSFFRDFSTFQMLRETVLPALIASRRTTRRLRIWSAGCSTGQETYSVAMLLCDAFPELQDWDVQIVGTDISEQAVTTAQMGRYRRIEVNRGLPVQMLMRHLVEDGDLWEMSHALRRKCEFSVADLCKISPGTESAPVFDLILLRNVMLYLRQKDHHEVFVQLQRQVAGDGYLVLGRDEQAEDSTDLFSLETASGGYVYRPAKAL
jgi:chemotaxis protein methyltransferase CheR